MFFLQEHTEDLQNKAMNSLFSLVCSLYKVCLQPEKCLFVFNTISVSYPINEEPITWPIFFLCVHIGWKTSCLYSRVEDENHQLLLELIIKSDNNTIHVRNGEIMYETYMLKCIWIFLLFLCAHVCESVVLNMVFCCWLPYFYSHVLNLFLCINKIKVHFHHFWTF